VPLRCKASTTARYRQALTTYWLPRFGDRRVTEITRDDVKAALADLGASLAKSTVRYFALPPLKGCLTYAVEQGVLVASPAGRVGRYVQDDRLPQERLDPFTAEELAAILTVAHDDFPAWYPAILTAARTGLRPCEWSALQRDDLDFRGGAVLVQRRVYCGQLSTPKTKKGRRVDMSTQLSAVLQGWLTLGAAEAAVEGRPPGPWLFPGPNGRPVRRQYFTDAVWRPILRRASVRYRPPVQLRHSYASLLIQQGESLAYVRDQLGHHSIKLTVDTYCHWLPGSNRQAVDRLDRIGPPLVHPGADPATIRNPGATAGRPSEPNAVVTRG
jgi:integrase